LSDAVFGDAIIDEGFVRFEAALGEAGFFKQLIDAHAGSRLASYHIAVCRFS
jgi:hypothetical protein